MKTDQGTQFTEGTFTEAVLGRSTRLSMDGKGVSRNNVFVERVWCSIMYEEVYLRAYEFGQPWLALHRRLHQTL